MTFKKLVKALSEAKSMEDINTVCGYINKSYELGKISFDDHELLFDLASKVQSFYVISENL